MSEDEASEMPQAFKDTVMKTVPIIADEHERDVQAGSHNLTLPPFIHSFFIICSEVFPICAEGLSECGMNRLQLLKGQSSEIHTNSRGLVHAVFIAYTEEIDLLSRIGQNHLCFLPETLYALSRD